VVASSEGDLPDVAELFGRILQGVSREQQPLLVARAERMAAARYRGWAEEVGDANRAARLRQCADREEEIAERVEALYPDVAALRSRIRSEGPDLEEITRSTFAGRPLAQQLAIQASGERLGAATWRAFAAEQGEPARSTFLGCAELEEASAAVLDEILAADSKS
jgi:hypothetical protein